MYREKEKEREREREREMRYRFTSRISPMQHDKHTHTRGTHLCCWRM
jgi:hypothetical protein